MGRTRPDFDLDEVARLMMERIDDRYRFAPYFREAAGIKTCVAIYDVLRPQHALVETRADGDGHVCWAS